MERRLASDGQTGRFCHGDTVTMADIVLMSIIVVTRAFKIEVTGTPPITRIAALCESLEAFAKADPMRQEGAPQAFATLQSRRHREQPGGKGRDPAGHGRSWRSAEHRS